MLMGAANTIDAINDYRETLSRFKTSDLINPDSRAELENKYNNMLMQVKEVYALGALTGPDQGVLENILKNPISFKGAITSTKALDKQAEDMIRIMAKVGKTAAMPKEQILEKLEKAGSETTTDFSKPPEAGTIEDGHRFKGGDPADEKNWEKI
jgi:hypothetical protein